MSTQLDDHYVADLLPLYVLGALEPADMQAITTYLQQHPDLQERLAALEEVVLQLAQSAPAAPLPRDARARLFARVQAEQRTAAPPDPASLTVSLTLPHTPPHTAAEPVKSPTSYQNPLLQQRFRRMPPTPPVAPTVLPPAPRSAWAARLGWLVATAALLLALVFLNRITILTREIAQVTAEVTTLRQQNQQLETQLRASQNQLALFWNAERRVALAGTELAPAAQGAFYLSTDDGVVVLQGLDPLPPDRSYQLWLVPPGGTPTSVALLPVDAGELYSQTVTVPPALRNFAIVDVSIEPAGGSPTITKETIVLRGVLN